MALLWHPQLAIVGSRSATPAGRDHAASFARALGRHGLVTTSGLAAGIDAAAHLAALDSGAGTVAVVATGPDQCYPRCNRDLARRIEAEGVLVSEHPPGTPARPQQFPSRNRIVAGLSLGTLVVEAAERSGALISARLAADAGREVFALPGSIRNPMARGCHRLIRQGAALVERPTEILEALAPVAAGLAQALRRRLDAPIQGQGEALDGPRQGPIDPAQRQVWEALGDDPVDLDHLSIRTGLTVPELSSMLLLMELQGSVSAEHGRYARRH
nr:DNA-processing protein DprA [Alkalisalibacterium limincola]